MSHPGDEVRVTSVRNVHVKKNMKLPLRHFGLVPHVTCTGWQECVRTTLQEPLFESEFVNDDAGIAYAVDLHLTQGFYALLFTYVLSRYIMHGVIQLAKKKGTRGPRS